MKYFILLLIISWSAYNLYAQRVIEYHFGDKKPIFNESEDFLVHDGEFVIIKIIDLNPFLYKASITSEEFDYNNQAPDFFKTHLVNLPEPQNNNAVNASVYANAYNEFMKNVSDYKNYLNIYQELLMLVRTPGLTFSEINAKKNTLVDMETIQRIQEKIDEINKSYLKFREEYAGSSDQDKNEEHKEIVNEVYKKLEDSDFQDLAKDLTRVIGQIYESNFNFESSPLKASKDEIVYKIEISPIEDDEIKKIVRGGKDFKLPIDVMGGFNIDFSTGFFVTGLTNHKFVTLKDSLYGETDTVKKGYIIKQNNEGNVKLGLMAIGHAYYRWGQNLNVGINLGVGIVQDQNVNYLAGLSCIFGTKHRVILNGGITGGYVDRLSSLIEENRFYEEIPMEGTLTVKEFKLSWYLGISYNLP